MHDEQLDRIESDASQGRFKNSRQLDRIEKKSLTDIDQLLINTTRACESLDQIRRDNLKQFGALIGVIMALIGSKLIATPWYIDVAVILCLISGSFLAVLLKAWWKEYSWAQRATRISGATLMLVSAITQIWVYHPGVESSPKWFGVIVNALLILLAISLIWSGWRHPPKNGKDKCGIGD